MKIIRNEINNLYALRNCLALASGLFLVSILLGFGVALENPQEARYILEGIMSEFSNINEKGLFYIFLFIFINNAVKSFLVILFGFLFGIIPIIFLFLNGQLIGLVMGLSDAYNNGFISFFAAIIPHGIFEVPAILIAASYGICLGMRFFRALIFKEKFAQHFKFAMKRYLTVILPLLLLAALIETFLTPVIIELFK